MNDMILFQNEPDTDKVIADSEALLSTAYQDIAEALNSDERPFLSRRFIAQYTKMAGLLKQALILMQRGDSRGVPVDDDQPSVVGVQVNVLTVSRGRNGQVTRHQTMVGEPPKVTVTPAPMSTSVSDETTENRQPRKVAKGYHRDNAAVIKAFKWLSRNPLLIDTPSRQLAAKIKVGKDSVLKARKFVKDGVTDIKAALAKEQS
jgi:hypothetical protein